MAKSIGLFVVLAAFSGSAQAGGGRGGGRGAMRASSAGGSGTNRLGSFVGSSAPAMAARAPGAVAPNSPWIHAPGSTQARPPAATGRIYYRRQWGAGGWEYGPPILVIPTDSFEELAPPPVGPDQSVSRGESTQMFFAVDDAWLAGAADWIAATQDEDACFDRMNEIGRVGERFLADQAARLIPLCGEGADAMLQATFLLAPYIVDGNNAPLRIVSLFTQSSDKDTARTILREAGIALP